MSGAPSISSTAPRIASHSPPLSSLEQSAVTTVFARHIPSISYEPITKKGIQEFNPQIEWIYSTKDKPEPEFKADEEKKDGSNLGTVYKIVRATRKENASKWLGKIGKGLKGIKDDPNTKRTRSKKELNFDAIREKIGYDFYQEFGRGIFCVPKTRLSLLPILNQFITTENLNVRLIIQSIEGRTLESLRIMSRYINGYYDLKDAFVAAKVGEERQDFEFIQFLHNYRRPPDFILTPDRKKQVPLKGLIGLLAVGRMLGDTDIIGGRGANAGFVWVKNPEGEIIAAQVYKIDPGECFNFDLADTASNGDLSPSANWVVNTIAKKMGILESKDVLNDEKDLQIAQNNGQITIFWSSLSEEQKDEFLATLFNCSRYLQAEDILKYLFYRGGRFNRSELEQIPEVIAQEYQNELRTWFEMQLNIYGEELQDFKLRYPEQVLRAVYIDRYGELALPTSEETFPIRELFTQLALIEYPKEKKSEDSKEKKATDSTKKPFHEETGVNKEVRQPISLDELFSAAGDSKKPPPRKVLLLGSAGSGKTTLCQKIAHDWASGRLWKDKYKAVYWLRLREFNTAMQGEGWLADEKNLDSWLAKAIAHQVLGQDFLQNSLWEQMRSQKQKILIVLDGYDETSPELTQMVYQLLADPELTVVITSRHEATGILHTRVDRIVENAGFSDDQIVTYSQRFFLRKDQKAGQKESPAAFLAALRANPGFLNIAHIPLHLQMLCALWDKGMREFPSTLTALYGEMVQLLFDWNYHKAEKETKKITKEQRELTFACLGELALIGLEENHPSIPANIVIKLATHAAIPLNSFLRSGLMRESEKGGNAEYELIHLTFQEYLAALFISTQASHLQKQFVIEHRYHPRFQMVMRFLAGIINGREPQENLERSKEFFQWLYNSTPKMGADLLGFSQFEVVVSCLNECSQMPLHFWVHQNFHHQEMFLHLMECESPEMKESHQGWFNELTDSIASAFIEKENTNFIRKEPCKLGRLFKRYPLGLSVFWENLCRLLEKKDNPSMLPGALVTVARYGNSIPISFIHRMVVALMPLINRGILGVFSRAADMITTKEREIDYGVPLKALGKIGKVASGKSQLMIVDTLVEALDGVNRQVRFAAAKALKKMAKALPERQIPKIVTDLLKCATTRKGQSYLVAAAIANILEVGSEKTISLILLMLFEILKKSDKGDNFYEIVDILRTAAKVATEEQASVIVDNLVEILPDQVNINNWAFINSVFGALAQAGKRVPRNKVSDLVEVVLSFLKKSTPKSADESTPIMSISAERARAVKVLAQMSNRIPVPQLSNVTLIFLKELQMNPDDIFVTPAILETTKEIVKSNTLQQMPHVVENLSNILDLLSQFVKHLRKRSYAEGTKKEMIETLDQMKEALSTQDPTDSVSILLAKTTYLRSYLATAIEAQRDSKIESKEFSPSATDDIEMLLMEWRDPDPSTSCSALIKLGEMVARLPNPMDTSRVIEALILAKKHGELFMRHYVKKVLSLIPLRKYLECFATINWPQIGPVFIEQILQRDSSIFLQETSSGQSLCLNENNQIVSQPLGPHQVEFLKNWSKADAPLHEYTASYL